MAHGEEVESGLRDADVCLDTDEDHGERSRGDGAHAGVGGCLLQYGLGEGGCGHGEEGFVVEEGGRSGGCHLSRVGVRRAGE